MEIIIDSNKKNYIFRRTLEEEIIQNIENIISRIKGKVVLARQKGISFDYVDLPFHIIKATIISDVMEEIEREEPRFNIEEIKVDGSAEELAKMKIIVKGGVENE